MTAKAKPAPRNDAGSTEQHVGKVVQVIWP
jgi:hypothetical protein